MDEATDADLLVPEELEGDRLSIEDAHARLASLDHPKPRRWLERMTEAGEVTARGDPPRYRGADL